MAGAANTISIGGGAEALVGDGVMIVSMAVSVVDDRLVAVQARLLKGGQLLEQEHWGGQGEEGLHGEREKGKRRKGK